MSRAQSVLTIVALASAACLAWLALHHAHGTHANESVPSPESRAQTASSAALTTPATAGPRTESARDVSAPVSEASPTEPAAAAATESSQLLLYGFVRKAVNGAALGDAYVAITNHLGERQSQRCSSDGAYSFAGLTAGHYWVSASTESESESVLRQIDLSVTHAENRLDLQLVLQPTIVVKVVDSEGKPFDSESFVSPVATLAPPSEWLDELCMNLSESFGVGTLRWNYRSAFDPAEGFTLLLQRPPPVYVSIVYYQHVIATKRVEPGDTQVEFVVDRSSPALQTAALRVRFVDAETHAELEPKHVSLEAVGGARYVKKEGDAFRIAHIPPGYYQLRSMLRGYESLARGVHVLPGTETDLGDVELQHEQWISGTVVDDNGIPCKIAFRRDAYDCAKGAAPDMRSVIVVNAQNDGSFRIDGLSRGTYRLRTMSVHGSPDSERWAEWCKVIDTSAGPVENVRVQLARGVPLVLRASDPSDWRSIKYQIIDAAGAIVRSSGLWSEAPTPIVMAPGSYTIEVRVGDAKEPKRIPVTLASEPVQLSLP
jgi:hypothetical protein